MKHKLYATWNNMKARCHNPNNNRYYCYGAKGITVCDSWRNSFKSFLEDMGEKPVGMTLDRKDSTKGYCKDNCRWATIKQQANNKDRIKNAKGYRFSGYSFQSEVKGPNGERICKRFKKEEDARAWYLEHRSLNCHL